MLNFTKPIWVKYSEGVNDRHGVAISHRGDCLFVHRARKETADSDPYLTVSVFEVAEGDIIEFPARSVPPRYGPIQHLGVS